MKKFSLVSIIIVIGLFFFTHSHFAFATSGACSSHSGVNCSAGPGLGGKVICNDGWIDSSVYYISMDKCSVEFGEILNEIAEDVRNRTPEQQKRDNEETCRTNAQFAKDDPNGFMKYKNDLESLGISMVDCSQDRSKSSIVHRKDYSEMELKEDPKDDFLKNNPEHLKGSDIVSDEDKLIEYIPIQQPVKKTFFKK